MNKNTLFNFFSERSNAFALLKERATLLMKQRMVEQNVRHLDRAEAPAAAADGKSSYPVRLTGRIFDRIHRTTQEFGIPLVIHSIPSRRPDPERLIEVFPLEAFDVGREGVWFLPAKQLLDPWIGREQLYHEHSHHHWTPHSHAVAGRGLAGLIIDNQLLD